MRMEILENIVATAVRWLMSLMGTDDMWFIASVVAIALVVLLFLVILLFVLLVRARGKLKKRAVQIDELESQVMGLQALTQLSGGTLSDEGDSIVYKVADSGQQIRYEEFPRAEQVTLDLSVAASSMQPEESCAAREQSRSYTRAEAGASGTTVPLGTSGLELPDWLVSAAADADSELLDKLQALIEDEKPKATPADDALRPLDADQIRAAQTDDKENAEAEDAPEEGEPVPIVSVAATAESFDARLDDEVDAILKSIKRKGN